MVKKRIGAQTCEAFMECMPDAAVIVDKAGRIVMANALVEKMFGYKRDELLGQPVKMLVPENLRGGHSRNCAHFFAKPATMPMGGSHAEIYGRRRDGSKFAADISLSPMEMEMGPVAMATIRDITALKNVEAQILEEKAKLENVTDFANCAFFALDGETRVVYANKVAEEWFGDLDKIKGKFCWQVFSLDDPENECAGLEAVRTGKKVRRETFAKMADGTVRFVLLDAMPVKNAHGEIEQVVEMAIDMTKFKLADDALTEANERFMALIKASPLAITAYDARGRVKIWNEAAARIFGWRADEVIGRALPIIPAYGRADWRDISKRILKGETITGKEVKRLRRDGSLVDVSLSTAPTRDAAGDISGIMAVLEDITERKAAEAKLAHMALHDLLTGLPNRDLLKDRLDQAIAYAERGRELAAVIHLGLDQFKQINDAFGHDVGDALLKGVAGRLKRNLRKEDTIARVGGDEFGIILPRVGKARDSATVAEGLLEDISKPFILYGKEIFVSAGVGICLYPQDGKRPETLVTNAEHAMRHAKRKGRNNYEFFMPELRRKISEHVALEHDLIRALERDEFVVYYQPHVDIKTASIVGMEALVRWEHPKKGLIMPDVFVPTAEETGMIIPMGESVLRKACRQNKEWQRAGLRPLTVAVNLSGLQLQKGDLLGKVERVLTESKLAPHYLELELTETAIMENLEVAAKILDGLKKMGVSLAVDDFGTGYSSLTYLQKFAVNTLKIDRSFIKAMIGNPETAAIVKAIISMAHTLNLEVIAEGVETRDQLKFLRSLNGDAFQGFLFSAAVSAHDFERLLREEHRWPLRRVA